MIMIEKIDQVLQDIGTIATKCFDIFADYDTSELLVEENKKEMDSLVVENEKLKNVTAELSERVSMQNQQIQSFETMVAEFMDDKTSLLTTDVTINDLKYEVRGFIKAT